MHAVLPQIPLPGRVCVRLRLGVGVRERRRDVLSETPMQRSVHTCDRPAPAGQGRRRQNRERNAARLCRGPAHQEARCLIPAHDVPHRGRMGALGGTGTAQAHRSAIPLVQSGLWLVRRLSRRAGVTKAQGGQARTPGRLRQWRDHRTRHRRRYRRGALGCFLRLLHGHRFAQVGQSLSHPGLFQPGH